MHPRRTLVRAMVVALLAGLSACGGTGTPLPVDEAVEQIDLDTFLTHMTALGSDRMRGRQPGTPGYDSAAAYVVREVSALGLEPAGVDGSYRQPISFRRATVDPTSAGLTVGGQELRYAVDFALSPRALTSATDVAAPLVFGGFGISAPDLGYDDLEGVDVEGKLVVVLAGAPDHFGSLERTVLSSAVARDADLIHRGAVGVIEVQRGGTNVRTSMRPRVRYLPPPTDAPTDREELTVSITVPERVAETWLASSGRTLAELTASLESGTPASFDLDIEAHVRARYLHEAFESANVVARVPGSDPEVAGEHLVVTAHLDHIGVGASVIGDSIFNGTLDNASGSAALLTLAGALTRMEAPRRSVVFLWVTAEESGLLGSEYFARFPTVENVVANQNMDGVMGMIAAATDVLAFGYEHSNLSEAVDFAVGRTGTPVSPDPTPDQNLFIRSDQYAFVRQGIPAIWVQAGRTSVDPSIDAQAELDRWIVERYHAPTDDNDQPVDMLGVERELENNLFVTWHIADVMGPIRWDPESFLFRRFGR